MILLTCPKTGDVVALRPKGVYGINPDPNGRGCWILMDTGHKYHVTEQSAEVAAAVEKATAQPKGKEEKNG